MLFLNSWLATSNQAASGLIFQVDCWRLTRYVYKCSRLKVTGLRPQFLLAMSMQQAGSETLWNILSLFAHCEGKLRHKQNDLETWNFVNIRLKPHLFTEHYISGIAWSLLANSEFKITSVEIVVASYSTSVPLIRASLSLLNRYLFLSRNVKQRSQARLEMLTGCFTRRSGHVVGCRYFFLAI